jgi:prolyl-tRNA synthetase
MVHGDDSGLVLPPRIALTQVIIVPIAQHKGGVLEKANELKNRISNVARVKLDASDKMPGWKFNEYEMKGIPVRVEIGPKDIEQNQAVLVRRDTREKVAVNLDEIETRITELLEDIHKSLLEKARKLRDEKTYKAITIDELKEIADTKPGFIKAMWCGKRECEEKIKETAGLSSRCIPFEQEHLSDTCVCCGEKAEHMVYWGKAY